VLQPHVRSRIGTGWRRTLEERRVDPRRGPLGVVFKHHTQGVVFIANGTQCRAHSHPMQRLPEG
jgi:hypothetical protein